MKRHTRIILMLCSLWASFSAIAQNTTNLPTSMYGVGELAANDGGRYAGMGNIGIAVNRIGFQNTQNPAAITRMDTTCFTFDVGAFAAYARYSFLSESSSNLMGNPNRISLGFRIMPKWYVMLGAAPYSSVGYLIQTDEEVHGYDYYAYINSIFEGEGGLYRCYLTNAYSLTKNLSVGMNLGMVFGTTTQSETQEGAVVEYETSNKAFYIDFGVHYSFETHNNRQWAVGAVFAPSLTIKHDNTLTYYNTSTSETQDKSFSTRTQYLPMRIGLGVSTTTARWLLAADYNYVDWSRNSSSYTSMEYKNQHKINIGACYVTNPRMPRSTEWMGGLGFNNSYMKLKDGKMMYFEASVGLSIPIRYSFLSFGATWRQQVNSQSRLMEESRLSLNVNLTFGERISRSRLR